MQNAIVNIAGYHFVALDSLPSLKAKLKVRCDEIGLKGTILISHEGINVMLAGRRAQIDAFDRMIHTFEVFGPLAFKESYSDFIPFEKMCIKIKSEIISMRAPDVDALHEKGKHIKPAELKAWLDENKDFYFLDTRNDYECEYGLFNKAQALGIENFREFPDAVKQAGIPKDKPVVMYCTGGVRCEKASLLMEAEGYDEVYQLEGGILKYFEECGGAHYRGDCFVFDDRIALTPDLSVTSNKQGA